MQTVIYTFPDYHQQGKDIAEQLGLDMAEITIHHFPDKESLVTLPNLKTHHVILVGSFDYPNNKLVELLFTCKTLRKQGTQRISLVAPYLCYMRQDKAFHPGEVISQQVFGEWLSELVDDVITVDPHLHRTESLDKVMHGANCAVLTAAPLLGEFISTLNKTVHLIGPDEESLQWVRQVAHISHSPYSVASKQRFSDTRVKINLPEIDYSEQHVILIDDIISTGHTVAETAKKLYAAKAKQVDVLITHALFKDETIKLLSKAKIKHIWSCNSITHSTNQVSINSLLAQQIKTLL